MRKLNFILVLNCPFLTAFICCLDCLLAANQKNLRACRIQKYLCEFELTVYLKQTNKQEVTVELILTFLLLQNLGRKWRINDQCRAQAG